MFSTIVQRAVEIGIGVYRTQLNAQQVERMIYSYGEMAMRIAIRFFQVMVIGFALFSSSCMIFALLYLVLMPRKLHDKEVFFDYGPNDYYQPSAHVDFLTEHTQWTPTNLTRTETIGERILKPGLKYSIFAELVMPESEANHEVGVFMVDMSLRTTNDHLLAHSRRPVLMRYRSGVVAFMSQLLGWPIIASGLLREEQKLQIFCFDSYQESSEYPMTKAEIQISTTKAQVYSAAIGITAQLRGLPYLLQHHFVLTATCCIAFIMCMEASFFAIIYLWFKLVLMDEDSDTAPETAISERSSSENLSSSTRQPDQPSSPRISRRTERDLFTSGERYSADAAGSTVDTQHTAQQTNQSLRQRRPPESISSQNASSG